MTALEQITALTIGGESVSLATVLQTLGHAGRTAFLIDAARELLIERAVQDRGLATTAEDLQVAADSFRMARRLHSAEATQRWLTDRGWTATDLERHLELQLLRDRLCRDVVTSELVEQYFSDHRREYDQARLSHILIDEQSLAEELLAQIHDEDAHFDELAQRHSIDSATAAVGGELGLTPRTSLSSAVEVAVFAATEGEIVGPVQTPHGFHVIKVHSLIIGRLDQDTAAAIRAKLFARWLDDELRTAGVTCPLFRNDP